MEAPTVHRFARYVLRTVDLAAARTCYEAVLACTSEEAHGTVTLVRDGRALGAIDALPERARSMGAPPHWLGHLAVADLDAALARFTAAGATPLGPVQRTPGGDRVALVRDPTGAVLALASPCATARHHGVVWHQLHAHDGAATLALYTGVFHWRHVATEEAGAPIGAMHHVAFEADRAGGEGDARDAVIASTARLPGVHPHWLFYFAIDDLERALAALERHHGRVIDGPRVRPGGARFALCEDAHGAAFALHAAR